MLQYQIWEAHPWRLLQAVLVKQVGQEKMTGVNRGAKKLGRRNKEYNIDQY